jgi:hypothetical protein
MSRTWISRLCKHFLGSSKRSSPARRPAVAARPTLEALEGRDVPSTFTSVPLTTAPPPNLSLQPVQLATPSFNLPSPAMLAGKVVHLGESGNPSNQYGVLSIRTTTLQPDGSYTFRGVYESSVWDVRDNSLQHASVDVTGVLGVPRYTSLWNGTFSIFFDSTTSVLWSHNGVALTVDEHVHFTGTVTMSGNQASVAGQLYDCLEDPVTHMPLDQFCGSPPTSGTFM